MKICSPEQKSIVVKSRAEEFLGSYVSLETFTGEVRASLEPTAEHRSSSNYLADAFFTCNSLELRRF